MLHQQSVSGKSARKKFISVLQGMTPEQRIQKAFELTEMCKDLLRIGLEIRFPEKTKDELHQLFLKRLDKCHNKNY